jgi:hypothetical protein
VHFSETWSETFAGSVGTFVTVCYDAYIFFHISHPFLIFMTHDVLRSDYAASMYRMSWDYHVVMMSLVPDYSITFHTTSHSDSYYYRD